MNNKPFLKFLLCAAIPLVILLAMTITPLLTLQLGQEIKIKTMPVDPRDIFRGDYVTLNYEINEIPIEKAPAVFKEEKNWSEQRRTALYVILKKDGDYYVVDHAVLEKPKDGIYMKGYYEWPVWPQNAVYQGDQNIIGIRVSYNLDQYFLPENTGKSLEYLSQRGQLDAFVKVWNGYSTLVSIRP